MRKRIPFFWILLISCCAIACSSEFLRPVDGHRAFLKLFGGAGAQTGQDLVQTDRGEFVLLGSTASTKHPDSVNTGSDYYLVQTDSFGDGLLSRRYGRSLTSEDKGVSLAIQGEGYYLLGETTSAAGQTDIWLIHTNLEGEILWDLILGTPTTNEWAGEVALDADNGIIVVGTTTHVNLDKHETGSVPASDVSDIYLARISTNGELLWERSLGFEGADAGASLKVLPNDRIAVLGETDIVGGDEGNRDLLLFLIDESGIPLQSQMYGDEDLDEQAKQLLLRENGGLVALGKVGEGTDSRPYLVSISEINSIGAEWDLVVEVPCSAEGIAETPEGGLIISGTEALPESSDSDFLLVRLEMNGSLRWSQSYGSAGASIASNVLALPDSGYVFVGTHDFGSNTMMSLIRTNPDGQLNPSN